MLVEPCTLEIEQRNAGRVRESKRIDRELRKRLVRRSFRLVVEKMHSAIPDLEEINMI